MGIRNYSSRLDNNLDRALAVLIQHAPCHARARADQVCKAFSQFGCADPRSHGFSPSTFLCGLLSVRFVIFGSGCLSAARYLLQAKIIVEMEVLCVHHASIRRATGRAAYEISDQAVLDAKDDVRVQVLIARGEHMRHQRLVSGR